MSEPEKRFHLGKYEITTREVGDIPGCIPAPYDPTLWELLEMAKGRWSPPKSR